MEKKDVISLIDDAIKSHRVEVMQALDESAVILPANATDLDIRQTIVDEIENGNGYLTVYLGTILDKMAITSTENKSNWIPAAIAGATSLAGMFFGKKQQDKAMEYNAQQQAIAEQKAREAQKAYEKQMKIAQSQQAAQQMREETEFQNKRARTKRTVLTLSIIGGALLIGTVATIIILKKK